MLLTSLSIGGLDYVAVSSHQLEVSPSLPLLIVTLGLLDDEEVEPTEQLTVTLQSAEGERVEIDRPETEVFIISDDGKSVVTIQVFESELCCSCR